MKQIKAIALCLAGIALMPLGSCAPSGEKGRETTAPTQAVTEAAETTGVSDTEPLTETVPASELQTDAETQEEAQTEKETYVMKSFRNPLSEGSAPDPVVVYHDGYYYATYTEALGISLCRSRNLEDVLKGERMTVMTLCDEVQGNVWAPELHYNPAAGRWYIYASGSTNGWEFSSIRMFCLESETDDPFSAYTFKGYTDPNTLAIDQTVFYDEVSGTLYTAFSRFTGQGQVITLAVMG